MSGPEWFRHYFEEPYGEIYEEYLLPPSVAEEEAQFVCDTLELEPGAKILDCPCGYARHIQKMRHLFPDMVGIDLDPDCLRRGFESMVNPWLLRGDMRSLPFYDNHFDAIMNLFNSFGYFDTETNQNTLREFARVLKPGGQVIIDVANPIPLVDLIEECPQTSQQILDLLLTEAWSFDPETGMLHNDTIIELRDQIHERSYDVRLYTPDEIALLANKAGLDLISLFGDFDSERYDPEESPRLIAVARKPDGAVI